MNVLESRDMAMQVAERTCGCATSSNIPYVFKASFDKANRSSITSFRGPGLDAGMKIFEEIKKTFDVPVITDVHEPCAGAAGRGSLRHHSVAGIFVAPDRSGGGDGENQGARSISRKRSFSHRRK